MKRTSIIIMLGLAFLLSGCTGEIIADLYVQDIIDVVEGEQGIFANASIAVESPGSDSTEQVLELLKSCFRDVTNIREQTRDYTTYLLVDVKLPVVDITRERLPYDDLLTLLVSYDSEEGGSLFGFGVNRDVFINLAKVVKEEFWQTISFSDFDLKIRLINDTKNNVGLLLQNVYMNQKPIIYSRDYSLSRRDTIELRISDIMRDYAYEAGYVFFGGIK